MDKKRCFKCGRKKSVKLFYSHPMSKDGLLGKCKCCTKKDVKERRRHPDRVTSLSRYEKSRNKTEKRKLQHAMQQEKRRRENPVKYKAWTWAHNALRYGRLVKLPCKKCGALDVEAHHPDYRRYKTVVWLCKKHHREVHSK